MRSTVRPTAPALATAYTFRPDGVLAAMARNGDAKAKGEIQRRKDVAKAFRAVGS